MNDPHRVDGGSAFPQPKVRDDVIGGGYIRHEGMSLRDYFAGQALAGICGDGIPGSHHIPDTTARDAYELG